MNVFHGLLFVMPLLKAYNTIGNIINQYFLAIKPQRNDCRHYACIVSALGYKADLGNSCRHTDANYQAGKFVLPHINCSLP